VIPQLRPCFGQVQAQRRWFTSCTGTRGWALAVRPRWRRKRCSKDCSSLSSIDEPILDFFFLR